jgi:RNA polymerase sigma factor (sigma-70 family)
MDPSDQKQKPRNLSTRWKCRPDRKPGFAGATPRKTRRRRVDMGPLTEEQRQLATKFLPLARSLAKPLKLLYEPWRHEFESAACLALVEAARSFDPARNIKFATFARFRIRGALTDVGRKMTLDGWEENPDEAPGVFTLTPSGEEHGRLLLAESPPPVGSESEAIEAVEQLLRKLPKRHALVCRMHYLYGKSQSEIAEGLGCSQAEVTRLHKKALELLSEPYDADGNLNRNIWKRRRRGRKAKSGGGDPAPD